MQPVRRFDFDAAILFSDILVVPEAMGQGFSFREGGGRGDGFRPCATAADIRRLKIEGITERLEYVAAGAQADQSAACDGRTALLGFAGSPWTLANFMLEGGSARQARPRPWNFFDCDRAAYRVAGGETDATRSSNFSQMQIDCGVDAVQIFDSLGGLLPAEDFEAASGGGCGRSLPRSTAGAGDRLFQGHARLEVAGPDRRAGHRH